MTWFLRSIGDHDTHYGDLAPDGTVIATCGATFTPRPLPLGRISLPGHPYDPAQICPDCDTRREENSRTKFRTTTRRVSTPTP